MARTITFQDALIEGYSSKIRNVIAEKRVRFRALFTDKLAFELDVDTLSSDYWDGVLVFEIGQAGLVLRPSAMDATLELDVQAVGKFTVKRSDDGPLLVRFEAVLTGSAVALAEYHDSFGEAPGELTITVAEEQTSIDGTKVTMSAPGMEPVETTMQGIEDATAELKRAQRIRRQAAADGQPFDGGKEERA